MATKIVALFNLKPSVTAADYEAWAKTKDIPSVRALKSVDAFDVFKSLSLLGDEGKPPYAYIEILDVNDMNAFGGEVSNEAMQAIVTEFREMAEDISFILTEKLD